MEIEKLKISITADASEAIKAYKKLADAMGRLQALSGKDYNFDKLATQINRFAKATELAIKPLRELGDALDKIQKFSNKGVTKTAKAVNEAKKIAKGTGTQAGEGGKIINVDPAKDPSTFIKDVDDEIDDSDKKVRKAASGWAKFAKAMAKIVVYRAVRRILSDLSKAAKQGADNLYEFLNASDKAENKKIVKQLDGISTAMTALGNTFGVTMLTLLASAAPIIETLAIGLIQILNVINSLIARIRKSPTYLKANTDALKKWSEAVNHSLQGFDELNTITTSASASAMEMFTEESVDEAISGLGKEAAVVAGLTSALALLALAVKLLSSRFTNKNKILGKQSELTAKEASTVTELGTEYSKASGLVSDFAGAIEGLGSLAVLGGLLADIDNLGEKAGSGLGLVENAFSSSFSKITEDTTTFVDNINAELDKIKDVTVNINAVYNTSNKEEEETQTPSKTPALGQTYTAASKYSKDSVIKAYDGISVGATAGAATSGNTSGETTITVPNHVEISAESKNNLWESFKEQMFPSSWDEFWGQLDTSFEKLARVLWGIGIGKALGGATSGVFGYAGGGFVNSADLFYANENGVPEMVGRIGNRTAVANTEQITEAIASAVYDAMMSANQGGNVNVVLEGDAKKLFKVVQNEAKTYYRTTGAYAF